MAGRSSKGLGGRAGGALGFPTQRRGAGPPPRGPGRAAALWLRPLPVRLAGSAWVSCAVHDLPPPPICSCIPPPPPVTGTADPRSSQTGQVIQGLR